MRELQMRWQHSGGKPLTPLMQTVQARRATMYRRTRKSAEFRARRIESMRRGREDARMRSDEHTSELQSLMRISYAVSCLKKNTLYSNTITLHSFLRKAALHQSTQYNTSTSSTT